MIRTVIIGAGGIADKHVSALARINDVKVMGVIDPNYANAERIAKMCGAPIVKDIHEVIQDIDMIHLLTPPSKRLEYAIPAIEAGKHVLCEKPIAVTLDDAYYLKKLIHKNSIKFMPAFNMRFRPGYKMLQNAVLSGKLGEIFNIWFQRTGPGPGFKSKMGDTWRTDSNLACGMCIESLSHDIDMILGLGVKIKKVAAKTMSTILDLPQFDNNVHAVLWLDNGGQACINASWSSHLPLSSRGVIGTEGTAVLQGRGFFDFLEFRLQTSDMEYEQEIRINDILDYESYYIENKHFIECLIHDVDPGVSVDNGLNALEVSLAILHSSQTNCVVDL